MAGGAQAADVRVLQVADAAVHHLEALGRSAAAEVLPLDERGPEAAKRRIPGRRRAEGAAADDCKVELAVREGGGVSLHP